MTAKMIALTLRTSSAKSSTAVRWHRSRIIGMVVATSVFAAPASAQLQQTYPNRPIRLIAAQAAGAGTDIAARLFGQQLADAFGQQVVIDNRPGAGGIVGTELAAKASPDGYTLMMAAISQAVLPSMHKKLPYDIVKDFAPVSMVISYPFLLVVHPAVAAKSVTELIDLAKARPGQLNYASQGVGASAHLTGELFKSMTGINVVHVPYKGVAIAIVGILAGEASMGFYSVSATLPHVKTGRLRALAATGAKRSPSLPDLPTVAEAGVPGFEVSTWGGVLAPAGTPKSIITKLHGALKRILQLPDVKERLAAIDFEPVGNTPEEFGAFIKKEVARWGKVVRDAGIKPD